MLCLSVCLSVCLSNECDKKVLVSSRPRSAEFNCDNDIVLVFAKALYTSRFLVVDYTIREIKTANQT